MSPAYNLVLARCPDARHTGGGHIARCPAHEDRSPSLSIREGSEGVLLTCFAGCSFSEIVTALSLRMGDLFNESKARGISATPQRTPTAREVEAALREHLARILDVERQPLGHTPPITSRHHNRARAAVNRILGTSLKPVPAAWWEHAQHDADQLWEPLAERALLEIVRERYGLDTPVSAATTLDHCDAQDRAAAWLRGEAHRIITHSTRDAA